MNCILFFVFTYLFLNNLITTQALFLNQLKSFEKEKVIYTVFNYDKPISIVDVKNGDNSDFNIYKEEFIEKIEKKRQMNHQKSLHQIKHGDTIHVDFEKGLIGFKYLN
ncbi:hypothetical protein [Chryseobacterium sp.]|uniref:hypothetical protein n=1 Tax=Chryseobacterium sp. TaxID=1871047 RepID=UPI0028A0AC01|nr:hypothetical protein [Chryseobacterium sp.]